MDFLKRLKVLDDDGKVALTNVAVYTVLTLFAYTVIRSGVIDLSALGALIAAVGAYRLKVYQTEKTETRLEDTAGLSQQVTALTAERDAMRKALDAAEVKFQQRTVSKVLPPGLR
jgi:glycerol kinase